MPRLKDSDLERELRQRLIGQFLKNARERAALTQKEVADRLSYSSAQFVSNWERGVALPPSDHLPLLAELYRVPPREFLELIHRYQDEVFRLQKRQLAELFRHRFPKAF